MEGEVGLRWTLERRELIEAVASLRAMPGENGPAELGELLRRRVAGARESATIAG
jgi:hypothetical protein